jgi:hypothetical protein
MIYILVVLYNKSLQSSDTLKGLLNAAPQLQNMKASVLIWDNSSDSSLSNNDINFSQQKFSFEYYHCPSNKPLSYVYNNAIEKFLALTEYKYLVVLDDDSKISPAYFDELKNIMASNNDLDIILPVAKNNDLIISPAKLFFVKGNYFKKIKNGVYTGKLLAVNCGMAIAKSFIERNNFRYDTRLLSYGTDNYIMNVANNNHAKYYIMNSVFEHGYSFYDSTDSKKKAEVFSQIKRANRIAFSLNTFQVLMISLYNFAASFKNAVRHRSLKFFS